MFKCKQDQVFLVWAQPQDSNASGKVAFNSYILLHLVTSPQSSDRRNARYCFETTEESPAMSVTVAGFGAV